MKREIIAIDEQGRLSIPAGCDRIRMTEMELAELFGVLVPTIRAAGKRFTKAASCGNPRRKDVSACRAETMLTPITSKRSSRGHFG
ncbi:hypothetical protein [Alistipes muris]|uniref:hypothetical protein n=1 Tax=Alistipes muris TaxID=2941326 RepID=UPI00203ED7D3|nr:hypothetical protein [Alistipes muris]MCX4282840.1 hypothetical protein [Alistipes sp.]